MMIYQIHEGPDDLQPLPHPSGLGTKDGTAAVLQSVEFCQGVDWLDKWYPPEQVVPVAELSTRNGHCSSSCYGDASQEDDQYPTDPSEYCYSESFLGFDGDLHPQSHSQCGTTSRREAVRCCDDIKGTSETSDHRNEELQRRDYSCHPHELSKAPDLSLNHPSILPCDDDIFVPQASENGFVHTKSQHIGNFETHQSPLVPHQYGIPLEDVDFSFESESYHDLPFPSQQCPYPFYDPDFAIPRRPLAPARVYHFHVIYNHARSPAYTTIDTSLALRFTCALVERLETKGYVNSYFHDRDRRSKNSFRVELERVVAGSSVTILVLTPGFLHECLELYLQHEVFKCLLDNSSRTPRSSPSARLIILAVGVSPSQIPSIFDGHEVVQFEEGWEASSFAWVRFDELVQGSIVKVSTQTDARMSAKNSELIDQDAMFTKTIEANQRNSTYWSHLETTDNAKKTSGLHEKYSFSDQTQSKAKNRFTRDISEFKTQLEPESDFADDNVGRVHQFYYEKERKGFENVSMKVRVPTPTKEDTVDTDCIGFLDHFYKHVLHSCKSNENDHADQRLHSRDLHLNSKQKDVCSIRSSSHNTNTGFPQHRNIFSMTEKADILMDVNNGHDEWDPGGPIHSNREFVQEKHALHMVSDYRQHYLSFDSSDLDRQKEHHIIENNDNNLSLDSSDFDGFDFTFDSGEADGNQSPDDTIDSVDLDEMRRRWGLKKSSDQLCVEKLDNPWWDSLTDTQEAKQSDLSKYPLSDRTLNVFRDSRHTDSEIWEPWDFYPKEINDHSSSTYVQDRVFSNEFDFEPFQYEGNDTLGRTDADAQSEQVDIRNRSGSGTSDRYGVLNTNTYDTSLPSDSFQSKYDTGLYLQREINIYGELNISESKETNDLSPPKKLLKPSLSYVETYENNQNLSDNKVEDCKDVHETRITTVDTEFYCFSEIPCINEELEDDVGKVCFYEDEHSQATLPEIRDFKVVSSYEVTQIQGISLSSYEENEDAAIKIDHANESKHENVTGIDMVTKALVAEEREHMQEKVFDKASDQYDNQIADNTNIYSDPSLDELVGEDSYHSGLAQGEETLADVQMAINQPSPKSLVISGEDDLEDGNAFTEATKFNVNEQPLVIEDIDKVTGLDFEEDSSFYVESPTTHSSQNIGTLNDPYLSQFKNISHQVTNKRDGENEASDATIVKEEIKAEVQFCEEKTTNGVVETKEVQSEEYTVLSERETTSEVRTAKVRAHNIVAQNLSREILDELLSLVYSSCEDNQQKSEEDISDETASSTIAATDKDSFMENSDCNYQGEEDTVLHIDTSPEDLPEYSLMIHLREDSSEDNVVATSIASEMMSRYLSSLIVEDAGKRKKAVAELLALQKMKENEVKQSSSLVENISEVACARTMHNEMCRENENVSEQVTMKQKQENSSEISFSLNQEYDVENIVATNIGDDMLSENPAWTPRESLFHESTEKGNLENNEERESSENTKENRNYHDDSKKLTDMEEPLKLQTSNQDEMHDADENSFYENKEKIYFAGENVSFENEEQTNFVDGSSCYEKNEEINLVDDTSSDKNKKDCYFAGETSCYENKEYVNFADDATSYENKEEINFTDKISSYENTEEINFADEASSYENTEEINFADGTSSYENKEEMNVSDETSSYENKKETNFASETSSYETKEEINFTDETSSYENKEDIHFVEESSCYEDKKERRFVEGTLPCENIEICDTEEGETRNEDMSFLICSSNLVKTTGMESSRVSQHQLAHIISYDNSHSLRDDTEEEGSGFYTSPRSLPFNEGDSGYFDRHEVVNEIQRNNTQSADNSTSEDVARAPFDSFTSDYASVPNFQYDVDTIDVNDTHIEEFEERMQEESQESNEFFDAERKLANNKAKSVLIPSTVEHEKSVVKGSNNNTTEESVCALNELASQNYDFYNSAAQITLSDVRHSGGMQSDEIREQTGNSSNQAESFNFRTDYSEKGSSHTGKEESNVGDCKLESRPEFSEISEDIIDGSEDRLDVQNMNQDLRKTLQIDVITNESSNDIVTVSTDIKEYISSSLKEPVGCEDKTNQDMHVQSDDENREFCISTVDSTTHEETWRREYKIQQTTSSVEEKCKLDEEIETFTSDSQKNNENVDTTMTGQPETLQYKEPALTDDEEKSLGQIEIVWLDEGSVTGAKTYGVSDEKSSSLESEEISKKSIQSWPPPGIPGTRLGLSVDRRELEQTASVDSATVVSKEAHFSSGYVKSEKQTVEPENKAHDEKMKSDDEIEISSYSEEHFKFTIFHNESSTKHVPKEEADYRTDSALDLITISDANKNESASSVSITTQTETPSSHLTSDTNLLGGARPKFSSIGCETDSSTLSDASTQECSSIPNMSSYTQTDTRGTLLPPQTEQFGARRKSFSSLWMPTSPRSEFEQLRMFNIQPPDTSSSNFLPTTSAGDNPETLTTDQRERSSVSVEFLQGSEQRQGACPKATADEIENPNEEKPDGEDTEAEKKKEDWLLGLYRGVCHSLSNPDMPFLG